MGSAMTKDMEAELFRTVEEGKKAAHALISYFEKQEILLQQYTKETSNMRGRGDDKR